MKRKEVCYLSIICAIILIAPSMSSLAQDEGISIIAKAKKSMVLVAVKNNGDTPVYSLEIKTDGIRFIKAREWERNKVDSNTVLIKTDYKPIMKGHTLIVLLLSQSKLEFEWKAYDSLQNIISTGTLGKEQTQETIVPQPQKQDKQSQNKSSSDSPTSTKEYEWELIAELQNVSAFGKTVRTETLCAEKLNWKISWTGGVYAVRVHGIDNSFYEELTGTDASGDNFGTINAEIEGCFFVFPVSVDGSGAVWVYGDRKIEVKKYLPEPTPEFLAQMKNAKRAEVNMGDFPTGYSGMGSLGYGSNAYYRPSYGTLGKLAYACFEELTLPFDFMQLMEVRWDVKGEFNVVQIYREVDVSSVELVYETHEPKGDLFIYDKGCYYGYADIDSMDEFVLTLRPTIANE